ncbi:MAG: anaerobic ribonucleoside-triphosphate reductase activating protein [Pseudomonadota bacterium]|nr:anaerobic ribonucleoside-triphosphate reductase activating protein [Pseudomonadota bacterium]
MKIGGWRRFSLIDYPGRIGAVVFTQGCNFRCPYCHNPELVDPRRFGKTIPAEDILAFLSGRRGKLDAVTVTGGEPTLQRGLADFLTRVKEMGFLVKLDTNGAAPAILARLLEKGLVDYIAMDVKGPLDKYAAITGVAVDAGVIVASVSLISASGIAHEFRTTLAAPFLTPEDVVVTAGLIPSRSRYVLQRFAPAEHLAPGLGEKNRFTDEEIDVVKSRIEKHLSRVAIR